MSLFLGLNSFILLTLDPKTGMNLSLILNGAKLLWLLTLWKGLIVVFKIVFVHVLVLIRSSVWEIIMWKWLKSLTVLIHLVGRVAIAISKLISQSVQIRIIRWINNLTKVSLSSYLLGLSVLMILLILLHLSISILREFI